jgi:hypothetical protein
MGRSVSRPRGLLDLVGHGGVDAGVDHQGAVLADDQAAVVLGGGKAMRA